MPDFGILTQYAVVAFASLFIIVDPLATAPLFVVMTAGDPPDKSRQMARRAAGTAALTLTGFALLGDVLLRLFSLTLSAFRITGGIILFGIALNMMRLRHAREIQTPEEVREGIAQDDIALIPLAFPMLSGPGAIATVMALTQQAHTLGHRVVILAAIVATCGLAYIILGHAARVTAFLGKTGLRFLSRLLGLLLAAIAVQFILQGVEETVIRLWHQLQ
jgi:multiple antibiotic resistance protein